MNVWTYAYLVVGLLLLAAPASALIPDTITIDTNATWVTAGSSDAATVTVQVSNSTSGNVSFPGVAIDFAVDSTYGSISPAPALTNGAGEATAVFRPGTRSGDVTITARFSSLGQEVSNATVCRVDHAAPYVIADILYEPEVTVAETTAIAVRVADRYGNPVDSRREDALNTTPETVYFMVGSPTGNATFVGAAVPDEIAVQVDAAGNATAMLRVDTAAGENLVMVLPPVPVRGGYISITGVADGVPSSITQVLDPPGASVPADGDKVVEFTYTLLDGYGNLVAGQGLWVNATIQRGDRPEEHENALLYSNSIGQVMITYGPEDSVGIVTITATAAANANVSVPQVVEFTSTDPVNMLLSANPQSMPSRDVKADTVSQIRAKVMDVKGNPVEGQTVTFEIVSMNCTPYVQTEEPALEKTSAITNVEGYAIVEFYPGAFTTDRDAPDWSDTATGTATVRATWNGTTRTIPLTWKNYPYLSVETAVSPETVAVNETVNVTIRLKGDGWALQPDPIDVVLVIDRSGSMDWAIDGTRDRSGERMTAAKNAANTFVSQMDPVRDRIGLVSFSSSTTVDNNLGDSFEVVTANLNALQATGATQLRRGIYEAILMQKESPDRPGAVKAVVVMTDGDWNYDGSPIGHGTGYPADSAWAYTFSGSNLEPDNYRYYNGLGGTLLSGTKLDGKKYRNYEYCLDGEFTNQNMSRFASDNGVKLYTIAFAYSPSTTVNDTMRILSTSTGGFYEHARSGDELTNIYERIAGELKTEAGVDTELDVVFEHVEVNEAIEFESGADVFDYVYEYGASTTIESWVDNATGHYEIISRYTRDDTLNWTTSPPHLPFNIGTVRLGQTWETTFRLKVLTDGNINVFGPGSTITFNNGTDSFNNGIDSLELPDTFITAVPDLNNTGITSCWLAVALDKPEPPVGQDAFYDTIPLTWTVTYNGTQDIHEALAYSNDNGRSWTVFWTKTVDRSTTQGETLMDVRDLPAGEYCIRLVASALDAPEATDKTDAPVSIGNASRAYIQIG